MINDGHRETKRIVDLPHPRSVTTRKIIVYSDDVNTFTRECIEICGQSCNQGLTFTGFHLGNTARVEDHASDQLHIEMTLTECATRCFTNDRKSFGQNTGKHFLMLRCRKVRSELCTKFLSLCLEVTIGKYLELFLKGINSSHKRLKFLDVLSL